MLWEEACCWCRRSLLLVAMICANFAENAQAQAAPEPEPIGSFAVEPYGFALYPVASRGVELSVNMAASDALAINYVKGEHHQLLMHYDADLLLLRYRHYFDGWMRGQLGMGVSQIRQAYATHLADGSPVAMATTRQMLVGELSVGHELQLGPVVLACDWFGVVIPLSKLSQTQTAGEGVDPVETKENRDAFDRISFVPALQIMRVSVGMAI